MSVWKVTAESKFKANFLWPFEDGSIEEAGFEFANAKTKSYQKRWWKILVKRIEAPKMETIKRLAKYHKEHP